MAPRARQPLRLIHDAVVAALQPDPLPEFLLRCPRGKKRFRQPAALLDRWGSFAKQKHPCRKLDAQLPQVRRPASAEHLQRFRNLVAVPRHSPQRLIHVRDQRDDLLAHALARSTITSASRAESSSLFINAPVPVFTSSTS